MKIKLNTVSVIESENGIINQLHSFTDTPKGNKAAERVFRRKVRERHDPDGTTGEKISRADMDEFLDNGTYDAQEGYQLFLVHSV